MSILSPHDVPLGGLRAMTVRRTLPNRHRSTIGAWCFVDHFGPDPVEATGGMHVAPHPHTGLQTVTWLFEGEVEHHDSVGSSQLISPGQVNLMTAGAGISHSEVSTSNTHTLHGVQLWVALPNHHRFIAPFFEHHVSPQTTIGPAQLTVFVGSVKGDSSTATSEATTFTGLVAAEILIPAQSQISIPVNPDFEHGFLVDSGSVTVRGEQATAHQLAFVNHGVDLIELETTESAARVLLIGGEPFEEELVMWWNFIGRSHDEIVQMRTQWQEDVVAGMNPDGVFGTVTYDGSVIPAPEMPHVLLRPRKVPHS